MKKTILFLIAATVMFAHVSMAQDFRNTLNYGIKGGLNLSNVYDSEGEDFEADAKTGLVTGFFLSLPLGSLIGFHPEMLFSQKGFKASGSTLGNSYTFTRTLNYFDIPLFFAIKPGETFTIVVGPQYSYLISRKDVLENSLLTIKQKEDFANENLYKNTLCFTGGFDVNVSRFIISARAGWDLFHNNGDGTTTMHRYKNVWYQATLAFRL